jgi:hypothetical protein
MKKTTLAIFIVFSLFLFPFATAGAQEVFFKLKVVTEKANLRVKPDIGSTIIRQVPQGTILESVRKVGEWYLVRFTTEDEKTLSGYVHESLVLRVESIEEKEKKDEQAKTIEREEIQITPPYLDRPFPEEAPDSIFSLTLLGGGNYVEGGDLNKGAQGFVQYNKDRLGIEGGGEAEPLHLSYLVGGELNILLTSKLYLGIGVDYFLGKKESLIQNQETSTAILTTSPKIKALPVRVVLSYYPLPFLYLKSGVEYYFTECTYFYRLQEGDYWKQWEGEARAQGLGVQGGLGIEWSFSPFLSLIMEASGRYSRIKGFTGSDTSTDSDEFEYTEEGTLYLYQAVSAGQNTYPQLFIRAKKPAEAGVADPREAFIDFSGLSLRLGIRIKI